jgi:arylsulfatase A-like enzyme
METDAAVGRIMRQLKESEIDDDTLIVFTSDNGCSDQADFKTLEAARHYPSIAWRGFKSKVYEGGHRVPFIIRWPKHVTANSTCSALIGLQDLYSTCADLVRVPLATNEAEDSISFAKQLLTQETQSSRLSLVHHSLHGRFSLRSGNWKLVFWPDGGGFGDKFTAGDWQKPLKLSQLQLFDLQQDPSEKNNVAESNLEIARKLSEEMKKLIHQGATRTNAKGSNDVEVHWMHPDI